MQTLWFPISYFILQRSQNELVTSQKTEQEKNNVYSNVFFLFDCLIKEENDTRQNRNF